jgi:hypothetical protein
MNCKPQTQVTQVSRLIALAGLLGLCQPACAGHGSVNYRGFVMTGDRTRHIFTNEPPDAPRLQGARVVMFLVFAKDRPCADAAAAPKESTFVTGPDGRYRHELTFGSMIWDPDNVIVLCVSQPGYESYEFRAVYEKTPWPEKDGTKSLNFYLRKKSAPQL